MLTVINGPMFSGKTSRLISICSANVIAGNSVTVFKPAKDDRYDINHIVSHSLEKFAAYPIREAKDAYPILDKRDGSDIVCFDEAQFFDNGIVDVIMSMYGTLTKEVICAGLSQDSDGRPFGCMPYLMAVADNIINLKAVCSKCRSVDKATRTFRKVENNEQVLVGGSDKYEANCFSCWWAWRFENRKV